MTYTTDAINALTETELHDLYLLMIRDQLRVVNDMTTPMNIFDPPDVHALHSDDGWDYLGAALDLAAELVEASPVMMGSESFRTWMLNKIDKDHPEHIYNYACDGIANSINEAFWVDDDD